MNEVDDVLHRRARRARRSRPDLATREELAELLEAVLVELFGEAFREHLREYYGVDRVAELTQQNVAAWLAALEELEERPR